MYFDPLYIILVALPALILAISTQLWIKISYARNSKVLPGTGITGIQAGEIIKQGEGYPVDIEIKGGALSDHFDPTRDIVSLSSASQNSSVADIAVTAHEFGHVDQKFSDSPLFKLRNGLVPIVNIGSRLGYILIIVGILFSIIQLSEIGLILFASTTVFALITVPIEIDATKRGLAFIKKYNLIQESNLSGAKSVLNAAATTYVASLLTSLLNLLYWVMRVRGRD